MIIIVSRNTVPGIESSPGQAEISRIYTLMTLRHPPALPSTGLIDEPGFARWLSNTARSPLRQLVEVSMRDDVLSLAGGLPAAELFPRDAWREALASVLTNDPTALQYGSAHRPLKERIVALMEQRGVRCGVDDILITTGAQQALDLLTRTLIDPGDRCVVESATYPGALQSLRTREARILSVGTDLVGGLRTDELEELLVSGERPRFVYLVPDASNPTGSTLATERRAHLVNLATTYGFWIVEDDAYGHLWLDQPPPAALRSYDADSVIHVGSFSKIIAPALRLGWMVVPRRLHSALTIIKEANDLESSALTQRAAATFLADSAFDHHLDGLRSGYRKRRDAMLGALKRHFPRTATWTRPAGGMFVWVELPTDYDTNVLLEAALVREHIAFVPGTAFSADGTHGASSLRLSFSNVTPESIESGVSRIGNLLRDPQAVAVPVGSTHGVSR